MGCGRTWKKLHAWRELSAILFALQSFLPLLKGSYIEWFSDSLNASKIVQVGSMRSDLHVIALEIFHSFALIKVFSWNFNGSLVQK